MKFVSRAVAGAAKTMTSLVFAVVPWVITSAIVPMPWQSFIVYLFIIVDGTVDAMTQTNFFVETTPIVAPPFVAIEHVALGLAGSVGWTVMARYHAPALMYPALFFLVCYLLMDVSIMWVIMMADGMTYEAFVDMVADEVIALPRPVAKQIPDTGNDDKID